MKKNIIIMSLIMIVTLSIINFGRTEIPGQIHFQGILSDSKVLNGLYDMEFSLWETDQPGTTAVWH